MCEMRREQEPSRYGLGKEEEKEKKRLPARKQKKQLATRVESMVAAGWKESRPLEPLRAKAHRYRINWQEPSSTTSGYVQIRF